MNTKASFLNGFNFREPIHLINVISIDNEKQTKDAFHAFVLLVNKSQHRKMIKKLTIVDTTYLNRHYHLVTLNNAGSETAWYKNNKAILQLLEVPYEVVFWEDLVNSESYLAWKTKIEANYLAEDKNENFRLIIDNTAEGFLHKGKKQNAINYLLEECAGALCLEGYLTYPGNFNAALRHVIKKYKPELKLISYRVRHVEAAANKDKTVNHNDKVLFPKGYTPSFFGAMLAYQVDNLNLSPDQQIVFSHQFFKICAKFMDKKPDNEPKENLSLNFEETNYARLLSNTVPSNRSS